MISEVMPISHSIPSMITYARFSPSFKMRVQGSGVRVQGPGLRVQHSQHHHLHARAKPTTHTSRTFVVNISQTLCDP